jgi:hypothetical protein
MTQCQPRCGRHLPEPQVVLLSHPVRHRETSYTNQINVMEYNCLPQDKAALYMLYSIHYGNESMSLFVTQTIMLPVESCKNLFSTHLWYSNIHSFIQTYWHGLFFFSVRLPVPLLHSRIENREFVTTFC